MAVRLEGEKMEARKLIRVSVQLKETSQPIVYNKAVNLYQKGSLICIYLASEVVVKYPVADIFRIEQDYGYHGRR